MLTPRSPSPEKRRLCLAFCYAGETKIDWVGVTWQIDGGQMLSNNWFIFFTNHVVNDEIIE